MQNAAVALSFCLCVALTSTFADAQSSAERNGVRILAGDGSTSAPAYSFSGFPGVGFYRRQDGDGQGILFAAGGKKGLIGFTSQTLALESLHEIVWSSIPNLDSLSLVINDVRLGRDAPGVLRFIGRAPTLRLYGSYSGSSTSN